MPTYVVGDIHITDSAAFQTHVPSALATIARFGGRVIAGGGRIDEGWKFDRCLQLCFISNSN